MKDLVLEIIQFLKDNGYKHPDGWLSSDWEDLEDGVYTGIDDVYLVADENLKDYLKELLTDTNNEDYDTLKYFYDELTNRLLQNSLNESYRVGRYKDDFVIVDDEKNSLLKSSNGQIYKFPTRKEAEEYLKDMFDNDTQYLTEGKNVMNDKMNKKLLDENLFTTRKNNKFRLKEKLSERKISRLKEAKFAGKNYQYEVHWMAPTGRDILLGGSGTLDGAENIAKNQIWELLNNPWTSASEKRQILDSLYIYDSVNKDEDVMSNDLANFVDHAIARVMKKIRKFTESYSSTYLGNESCLKEEDAYDKSQLENAIKKFTKNFSIKDGVARTSYEQEKDMTKDILKTFYKVVEVSDGRRSKDEDMSWVIAFSEPR